MMDETSTNFNASRPEGRSILDSVLETEKTHILQDFDPIKVVNDLLGTVKQDRDRGIATKRFGLDGNQPKTLEEIGAEHHITRERVRQIERNVMAFLRTQADKDQFKNTFDLLRATLSEYGGAMPSELLFTVLLPVERNKQHESALLFLLNLDDDFIEQKETRDYLSYWRLASTALDFVYEIIAAIKNALARESKVIHEEELIDFLKREPFYQQHTDRLNEKLIESYAAISKMIARNPFGEYGLRSWSTIKPRDVGDKAYVVLQHHGKPEHYFQITELINKSGFDTRKAYAETVHNELIKDKRFVLVGRGIYALQEWGYTPGVVADVIVRILEKAAGPLERSEIIDRVLKERMVKRNTVLVGLANRSLFKRVGKSKYGLAETYREALIALRNEQQN